MGSWFHPIRSGLRRVTLSTRWYCYLICSYTDGSYLRINDTALLLHYDNDLDYCQYESIERPTPPLEGSRHNDGGPSVDNRFTYRRPVQFRTDVDLSLSKTEFVRVACYGRRHGSLLYANFHAVILVKDDVETRCGRTLKQFIIDKRPTDVSHTQCFF